MKASYFLLVAITWLAFTSSARASEPKENATTVKQSKAQAIQRFRLHNPDTMFKPTAGFSQVAEVSGGKIVYIAGQAPVDKSGSLIGKDDFRAQAQQVFENLQAAIKAAGGSFTDVIKLNIYCAESVEPSQLPILREVRDKYVNTANPPTSTFLVVKRLARPEWLIEIEAVAVVE